MKKISLLLAILSLCNIALWGQKKYEMVIEKTDGSSVVINVEEIVRTYFRVIEGTDDPQGTTDESRDSRFIGTWYQESSDGEDITAYRFEADGKCYYNEWMKKQGAQPLKERGTWSTKDDFITIDLLKGGQDIRRYEFSSDGSTFYWYTKDSNGEYTKKGRIWVKQ